MKADIEALIRDGGGVVRRQEHPDLIQRFDRLRARGGLVSVLPGILTTADGAADWRVRLRAGLIWTGPDAVVTRHSAARLTFWPDCAVDVISLAVPKAAPRSRPGWRIRSFAPPPEMVWNRSGVWVTNSAYTAVDLATEPDGGDIIDRALRSRQATLDQLWAAFSSMPNRRGNEPRAKLLRDSRDKPWSELERHGHRLLRNNHITGWDTNVWLTTRRGGYYVDVLFGGKRLIVEFDGWELHSERDAFEEDRRRRNELVLAGYTVLVFTWRQVIEDPDWVIRCICEALRLCAR